MPGWTHSASAGVWLKVAEQAALSGRPEEAASHAAKSWVFGDEAVLRRTEALVDRWRREGVPAEPPRPRPDADRIERVVGLYRQMHVHPRALRLLAEHGKVLGGERAAELRGEVEEEWLRLTALYCNRGSPRCVLWGQDITEVERRLTMMVPPPAPPETREEAREWLRELLRLMEARERDAP